MSRHAVFAGRLLLAILVMAATGIPAASADGLFIWQCEITFDYQYQGGYGAGEIFDLDWSHVYSYTVVLERRIRVDAMLSLLENHFRFPFRITARYDPSQVYAGNSFRLEIGVQPFNRSNYSEVESSIGLEGVFYEEHRNYVWTPLGGWGWTSWYGTNVGLDVGVDIDAGLTPPLQGDKCIVSDQGTTGFVVAAGPVTLGQQRSAGGTDPQGRQCQRCPGCDPGSAGVGCGVLCHL